MASRRRSMRSVRADGDWLQSVLKKALEDSQLDKSLSYAKQVKQFLRDAIVGLRLPPETPLSEVIIANFLGVSRTPVREAIRDLAAEGWLEIYPQAATVVAPIRVSLIEQGAFVRNALESANLMDLADTLTDADRKKIEENLERQSKCLEERKWDDFFALDDEMHQLFFELRNCAEVWPLVQQGKQHVDRARRLLVHRSDETCARAYAEHLKITKALFDRSKEEMANHLREHILQLKMHVIEYAKRTKSKMIIL